MDPVTILGAAAAAGQFAGNAADALKLAKELYSRIRHSPAFIRRAIEQLEFLCEITEHFEASSVQLDRDSVTMAGLARCSRLVDQLFAILKNIDRTSSDSTVKKAWKAVVSIHQEKEINTLLDSLEREKANLTLHESLRIPKYAQISNSAVAEQSLVAMVSSSIPRGQEGNEMFLRALFAVDPQDTRSGLITAKGERAHGTCSWILQKPEYRYWLNGHGNGLWVRGGPGKGKTMMSVFLTQVLEQHAEATGSSTIYFFCDGRDDNLNNDAVVLRSLIYQLCRKNPALSDYGLAEFRLRGPSLRGDTEALWRVFTSMIQDATAGTIFCIIDGLDECDASSTLHLAQKFSSLCTASMAPQHKLKPVLLSRPLDTQCDSYLSRFLTLTLDPSVDADANADGDVNRDLLAFISQRADEIAARNSYPEKLRQKVLSVLLERSGGTFLWAGFVLNELQSKLPIQVDDCLDSLPAGLDGIYQRILNRVQPYDINIVRKILLWVVMSFQPLTLGELAEATGVQSTDTISAEDGMKDYVRLCGHLLVMEKDEVRLVHQSARDFLTRARQPAGGHDDLKEFRISPTKAHSEIARTCIDYLQSKLRSAPEISPTFVATLAMLKNHAAQSESGRQDSVDQGDRPSEEAKSLLRYCITYWAQHARLSEDTSPESIKYTLQFLKSDSCHNWILLCREAGMIACDRYREPPINLAAYLGFGPIVDAESKRISNWARMRGLTLSRSPLCSAILGGHNDVAKQLLKWGGRNIAKSKPYASFWSSPIHIAAATNNIPVIKMLLEHGVQVGVPGERGATALHHAALFERPEACEFLLQNGAVVNIGDKSGSTPLHYASAPIGLNPETDDLDIFFVILIQQTKASKEAYSPIGQTTKSVTQILLQAGADPERTTDKGGRPLMTAARNGHLEAAKALLQANADVNAKDSLGWTALHLAAFEGHQDIVELLLKSGANADARNNNGRTALHHALSKGHKDVVECLRTQKADRMLGTGPACLY